MRETQVIRVLGVLPTDSGGDPQKPPYDPSLAGKLVYISKEGTLIPLTLGEGLEIVDSVLRLTGTVTPPETGGDDEPSVEVTDNTSKLGIARLGLMILGRE